MFRRHPPCVLHAAIAFGAQRKQIVGTGADILEFARRIRGSFLCFVGSLCLLLYANMARPCASRRRALPCVALAVAAMLLEDVAAPAVLRSDSAPGSVRVGLLAQGVFWKGLFRDVEIVTWGESVLDSNPSR